MKKQKIVALLPMKANSERVKGKNFKDFNGKPLFRWTLDTLLAIKEIDKIIIIDTIFSLDVPFTNRNIHGNITLGKGPVLERGGANRGLYRELSKSADTFNIPYQNYLTGAGGSNLTYFAKYNSMTQFVGVPARNLHSPVETVHLDDINSTYNLLKNFIQL